MGETVSVSVSLDKESLVKLDAMATADDRSRSSMIRRLIHAAPTINDSDEKKTLEVPSNE